MECITFPENREENQLSNANQIYFPDIFIQTSIHDSGMPHDPPRILQTTMQSLIFPTRKDVVLLFGSIHFIWVFYAFLYCFCHWTNAVLNPGPLKRLTKIACLHSFNQKKRLLTDGEGGIWGQWGKSPCHFLCPIQERFGQQELAFARLWQLEETVMSAILGWTV